MKHNKEYTRTSENLACLVVTKSVGIYWLYGEV